MLKEFAHRLKRGVRATDFVARLAGDEFVVILEGIQGAAEAELSARKIVRAMHEGFVFDGATQTVTTSVGIALFEGDATTTEALMARADAALYDAKRAGRDSYALSRPAPLALAG